jgi:hypothetical protein
MNRILPDRRTLFISFEIPNVMEQGPLRQEEKSYLDDILLFTRSEQDFLTHAIELAQNHQLYRESIIAAPYVKIDQRPESGRKDAGSITIMSGVYLRDELFRPGLLELLKPEEREMARALREDYRKVHILWHEAGVHIEPSREKRKWYNLLTPRGCEGCALKEGGVCGERAPRPLLEGRFLNLAEGNAVLRAYNALEKETSSVLALYNNLDRIAYGAIRKVHGKEQSLAQNP